MWKHPNVPYETNYIHLLPEWIRNLDEKIYLSNNFLVLDFETSTLDFGNPHLPENELVLAGWWYKGTYNEWYGDEFDQDILCNDVALCDFVVAHNVKFELGWLRRIGVDVESLCVWCTQVGEYVLRGNRSHLGLSLDATCKRRNFKLGKIKLIEAYWKCGIETTDIPQTFLSPYCRRDVLLALELFLEQRKDIISKELLKVMYVRSWLPVVLMDIESKGMYLDKTRVAQLYLRVQHDHEELNTKLVQMVDGVNFNSPDQVGKYLYETLMFAPPKKFGKPVLTPTGKVPTDKEAINSLVCKTKKQREFIKLYKEYSVKNTELHNYLEKFLKCCLHSGGILTGNLNQTVTKTHRLSSSGRNYACQFQNFNREFKPLFTTRDTSGEWSFVERDYSQLEFAIAVQLGQDDTGYKDIICGSDLHSNTASVLQPGFESLTGDTRTRARTKAKAGTFLPLFGGISGTKLQRRYNEYFKERYSGITATQETWINECLRYKQFRNPSNGLIFYFPNVGIDPVSGYIYENTTIRNIPIQSTATADVVLIGLVLLWHCIYSSELESFIVNTVHDSVETEEPPEERDIMDELSRWALLDGVYWVFDQLYKYPLQVPLDIETDRNTHWSETKEWRQRWNVDT